MEITCMSGFLSLGIRSPLLSLTVGCFAFVCVLGLFLFIIFFLRPNYGLITKIS